MYIALGTVTAEDKITYTKTKIDQCKYVEVRLILKIAEISFGIKPFSCSNLAATDVMKEEDLSITEPFKLTLHLCNYS